MFHYKGLYIWWNDLQGWMIQDGYDLVSVCKTLGGAKRSVTWYLKGETA